MDNNSALIVIDFQNDFCEGGSMANERTLELIPLLNRVLQLGFKIKIFTMDWHPNNHMSFKQFGGEFPQHCVQFEDGAKINPAIILNDKDFIVKKGFLQKYDSYSAFYNANYIYQQSRLNNILKTNDITTIYLCGIDFENTIFSTLLDSVRFEYNCKVIYDLVTFKSENRMNEAKKFLETLGIKFVHSNQLFKAP